MLFLSYALMISRSDSVGLNAEKRRKCGEGGVGLMMATVASCGEVAWGIGKSLVGRKTERGVV